MKLARFFSFIFIALLVTATASAVVWNTDKFIWNNGQKKITITNGESTVFSTGAFSSGSNNVQMKVEVLSKTTNFKKTILEKTIDVTEFTGFEKVTIDQGAYEKAGEYFVKVTLSDDFPDTETNFLELHVQEKTLTPTLVSLAIQPKEKHVFVGETVTYTATATYSDGTTKDVTNTATWMSTNTNVASMNKHIATAKNEGTTTIKVSHEGKEASATLAVQEKQITPLLVSMEIFPKNKQVFAGETITYSAVGAYSDGSSKDITSQVQWTSTNTNVASMNKNVATAKNIGVTTIKAASENIFASTTLTVKEKQVTLLTINVYPTKSTIHIGETQQYSAIATYSDGTTKDATTHATWMSTNTNVASMNKNVATAKNIGVTTIKATYEGKEASATLFVIAAIAKNQPPVVIITQPAAGTSVEKETPLTFKANATDKEDGDLGSKIMWSYTKVNANESGDLGTGKEVAKIFTTEGAYIILAKVTDSQGASDTDSRYILVTKKQSPKVVSLDITPKNQIAVVGETVTYTATATYSDGTTKDVTTHATWMSTNTNVASMNKNVATAKNIGVTTIKAAYEGKEAATSLAVKKSTTGPVLEKIIISPHNAIVYIEEGSAHIVSVTYTAIGMYSNGSQKDITTSVSWTHIDTPKKQGNSVVEMQKNIATAKNLGVARIIARLDGVIGQTPLTVVEKKIDEIVVAPQIATILVGQTVTYAARAHYTDGTIVDVTNEAAWNSTDQHVAFMNKNIATATNNGTTTISAHFGTKTGNAILIVNKGQLPGDPTVTIVSPEEGKAYKTPVLLEITATNYDTLTYNADNGPQIQYAGKEFLPFVDGTHTLTAYATKGAKQATDSVTFTIDMTAPVVSIEQPKEDEVLPNNTVTVTINVEDNAKVICTYKIEGIDKQGNTVLKTGMITVTESGKTSFQQVLPNGEYTVTVTCTDEPGNQAAPVDANFKVDNVQGNIPIVMINSPEPKTYGTKNVLVNIVSSDPAAKIEYHIDGSSTKAYTQIVSEEFTEGTHTLVAFATNAAGTGSASVTFTIKTIPDDLTAPVITIIKPKQNEQIWQNPVEFVFDVSDDMEVVECALFLNGKSVEIIPVHQKSAQVKTSKLLSEGTYALAVACKDATDKTTKTVDFTFKVTPPPTTAEPEKAPEQGIFVKKILVDTVEAGDTAKFVMIFKNVGSETLENVKVKASIFDLGISKTVGPFDLKAGDEMSKKLIIGIPEEAAAGDYVVRFTVYSEGITRVKHKEITVI